MIGRGAELDGFLMPFDPNSVRWTYTLNTASYDTLGGRVVQLLSVKIDSLTWEGDAGDVDRLIAVFEKVEQVMSFHEETNNPVHLSMPNQGWSFDVYLTSFPEMGYDNQTVTFPYSINFEVYQHYGDITTRVMTEEIESLLVGIGHDPFWHGPTEDDYIVQQISGSGSIGDGEDEDGNGSGDNGSNGDNGGG